MSQLHPQRAFITVEATLLEPEALLRFVLFERTDRRQCRLFGELVWVNLKTLFEPNYDYGTEHTFRFIDKPDDSGTFVSAMTPLLKQIESTERPGERVPMLTVYLASKDLFPYFPPLDDEEMIKAFDSLKQL